jgi:DNA-binding NtrC family response regulator
MATVNVLIFEEDRGLLNLYGRALNKAGYQVKLADSVARARQALDEQRFDIFLCDLEAEDIGGAELLERQRSVLKANGTQVIMMALDRECMMRASRSNPDFFKTKPPSPSSLVMLLNGLCDMRCSEEVEATPASAQAS